MCVCVADQGGVRCVCVADQGDVRCVCVCARATCQGGDSDKWRLHPLLPAVNATDGTACMCGTDKYLSLCLRRQAGYLSCCLILCAFVFFCEEVKKHNKSITILKNEMRCFTLTA